MGITKQNSPTRNTVNNVLYRYVNNFVVRLGYRAIKFQFICTYRFSGNNYPQHKHCNIICELFEWCSRNFYGLCTEASYENNVILTRCSNIYICYAHIRVTYKHRNLHDKSRKTNCSYQKNILLLSSSSSS